ncbi:hypothetical protein ACFYMX_09870 [Streptomyces griseofuscus]|uniref:Secreted protein n=3 Tax=Actinomycetes TaxID=1760 RepID=A0A1X4GPF1_9ACTN|nr:MULTISPECIES: hypothetical protein [Streptomyces]BBC95934.1 hypothetical protein SRO_4758 [Streptomyces rochei]MBA9045920.1 hypothetical protein [Streptomyces murinus]MBJ7001246.1 hypothetical protein [Streptomyces sp. CRPSP2-6A1]MYQ91172.1 hypothetical protein [Streptomyces sp. SID4946]QNT95346.1 hypothetical protein HEP81_05084 [Streptomyces griseofuscus]
MKSLKAAAVLAGSVALAGVAAPAFAYNATDLTPSSLNGAVNQLAKGDFTLRDVMPLQHQSNALDTEDKDSVLHSVKGATTALNQHNPLLGGLPLQS